MKTYKNCQSCDMPLNSDPKGGGTEADGSLSHKYCSYCYEKGAFIEPDLTAPQMQRIVKEKLREMGYPRIMAAAFTMRIPKLERWMQTSY